LKREQIIGRLSNGVRTKLLSSLRVDETEIYAGRVLNTLPTRDQNEVRAKLRSCFVDARDIFRPYLKRRRHLE